MQRPRILCYTRTYTGKSFHATHGCINNPNCCWVHQLIISCKWLKIICFKIRINCAVVWLSHVFLGLNNTQSWSYLHLLWLIILLICFICLAQGLLCYHLAIASRETLNSKILISFKNSKRWYLEESDFLE